VGDPITLMDSDPLITFMKVIVTFYPLLWIRLLVSFIAICTQLDWAIASPSILRHESVCGAHTECWWLLHVHSQCLMWRHVYHI